MEDHLFWLTEEQFRRLESHVPTDAWGKARVERGGQTQAIGRSRGGRTTKIHALTDAFCRLKDFRCTAI